MRILVLDGNENQAVACVRSLGRAGYTVWVGESTRWSKAGWSRYCRGEFTYPAPQKDAAAFVARVAEEARSEPGTLVLPMTERTTLPLSSSRETIFSAGGRLVLPSHATLLRGFDKLETLRLAASLGIAIPRSVLIDDTTQVHELAHSFRYPAVLKPRRSERVTSGGQVQSTGRPLYASRPREFLAAWNKLRRLSAEVIAQEFVKGVGAGYFALLRQGELRVEFAHRRIRDVHPTGSGSAVRVSVTPDPKVRAAGLAILQALEWHGVAMVEFRICADGTPVFLEVNGRFWNSLALAVYAGADFPALLARLAECGDVEAPSGYRAGMRCRWLLGDFRHLLEVWRGAPAEFPGKFPGRLRTLVNFLFPVPGTYHDNFALRDPLPELGDWLDFSLRRLSAQLKKRAAEPEELNGERRSSHS